MQINPYRAALAAAFLVLQLPTHALAQEDFRAKAFAAEQAGKLTEAADLFMKLYEAGAMDTELLQRGAACLERVERYNDALDLLTRGKQKFPADATFRVGLARVFNLKAASMLQSTGKLDTHAMFNFQDAIREGEELLELEPGNRDARLIVANSLYTIGEWDKVRPHAEELIKRFPDHPGGHIIMGDLAFDHYKQLRQRAGEQGADASEETMLKLAGAREAARQSYSKAISLDASRAAAHRKLGDVHAWNGEVDAAVAKYGDALLLAPRISISHTWITQNLDADKRVVFYETLGKQYLAKTNDKAGSALFAWYCAAALTAQKKFKQAEALYVSCVQLDPNYAQAYYYAMYSAYFFREDEDDALRYAAAYAKVKPIEFSDTVRAIATEDREQIVQLIKYLAKRAMDKRLLAACRDLNHALAAIVDTADAWNNYAFMARESGLYAESEKAYRHALEIQPNSGQLMNDLAVILHFHSRDLDKWKEAERLYIKARQLADHELADAGSTKEVKDVARVTKRDATNNLRDLRALAKQAGKSLGQTRK